MLSTSLFGILHPVFVLEALPGSGAAKNSTVGGGRFRGASAPSLGGRVSLLKLRVIGALHSVNGKCGSSILLQPHEQIKDASLLS